MKSLKPNVTSFLILIGYWYYGIFTKVRDDRSYLLNPYL